MLFKSCYFDNKEKTPCGVFSLVCQARCIVDGIDRNIDLLAKQICADHIIKPRAQMTVGPLYYVLSVLERDVVHRVNRGIGACGAAPTEFGMLGVLTGCTHTETVADTGRSLGIHRSLLFGKVVG